jgi:hypothetical protein
LLRRVTGQPAVIRFELDRTATAPAEPPARTASAPPAGDRKKSLAALPLFKKAAEALGAQVWHVDEDFNPSAVPRPAQPAAPAADADTTTEPGTEEG